MRGHESTETPIGNESLFNKIPNYHHLKVFGCLCYPYLRPYNKHKLCYCSSPCVFLGYSPTHKGYMCFDSNSNRIYITRHVKFHETKFPFQQTVNTSSASSSYQFTSPPALLPVPLSIPPTQTSQSLVPTSQSPHLSNYAHSCHSSHNSASLIPIPNPIPVPFTASSSSSLTNPSAPHNSHAMITRAKTGIFKKKLRLAYKPIEPYSFQQASKDPNWVSAMETEYKVSYRTIPSS